MSRDIWGEPEKPEPSKIDDNETEQELAVSDSPDSAKEAPPQGQPEVAQGKPKPSVANEAKADTATQPKSQKVPDANVEESSKEWRLIVRMVNGLHKEQRSSRRWGIFFKSLTFLYLFAILGFAYLSVSPLPLDEEVELHTAVIDVNGPISANSEASADIIISAVRRAFRAPEAQAVVLRINSPGGSPVQSGYIYDEIMRLKAIDPEKRVYAVISDVGASGAYYIAAAADEIYADKASLVGSIGVVAGGFGFVELMEKVGVERRLYTSGDNKAFLDPFTPENPDNKDKWQEVLSSTHQQFIDSVRKGRGSRLVNAPEVFSGLVWNGEQALELGLIDGLGSTSYVAREVVGVEKIYDYSYKPQVWEQLFDRVGVSFAGALMSQLKADTGLSYR